MNGYLLDTNVPSEMSRPRPARQVEAWIRTVPPPLAYVSVISLAETLRGIDRQKDPVRRMSLERWFESTFVPWFDQRCLPLTESIAERLGHLLAMRDDMGLPISFTDAAIAATALEHAMVLVTRNVADFQRLGLTIVNPWEYEVTS